MTKDRYTISLLHFNDSTNILKDECGNEWTAYGDYNGIARWTDNFTPPSSPYFISSLTTCYYSDMVKI